MLERAQLPGDPLPAPDDELSPAARAAWRDIVTSSPDVLRADDWVFVRSLSQALEDWRARRGLPVREMYRNLGELLMPMRERRRLLFPDRPKRKELS